MAPSSTESLREPPAWLSRDFVQSTLRNGTGDASIRILSIQTRPGNKDGDNYVSEIFRVAVTYTSSSSTSNTCSLIIKCPPKGDVMLEMVHRWNVFQKEGKMFTQILPKLFNELEKVSPGEYSPFGAKCLDFGKDPADFLVLEDLAPLGFKLAERRKGLDLAHSMLAIKTLARYHACSVAVHRKDPSVLAPALDGMFSESIREFMNGFVTGSFNSLANALEKQGREYEYYVKKLREIPPVLFDMVNNLCLPKDEEFKVCTHGDMWVNNMLFKYSEGKVCDVRFVDFQLSAYGSPAIDLQYFIHTSPSEKVRIEHTETLIDTYLSVLSDTLVLLGCPDVDHAKLRREYHKYHLYGMFSAICILPVVMREENNSFDVNEALGDGSIEATNALFTNVDYMTAIKRMLPEFRKVGAI